KDGEVRIVIRFACVCVHTSISGRREAEPCRAPAGKARVTGRGAGGVEGVFPVHRQHTRLCTGRSADLGANDTRKHQCQSQTTPKHDTQHGSLPRSHRICSINPTVKPRATRKARRKRWWSWVEKAAARLRFDLRGASGLEEQF